MRNSKWTDAKYLIAAAHRRDVHVAAKTGVRVPAKHRLTPRVVTVEKIERSVVNFEVRDVRRRRGRNAPTDAFVFLNGEQVGRLDKRRGAWPTWEVRQVTLTLSDGQTCTLSNLEYQVIELWEPNRQPDADGKTRFHPVFKRVLHKFVRLADDWVLTAKSAFRLKVGDAVTVEYPFQWVDGVLTDGVCAFPKRRPERSQWRKYPFPAIPAECWGDFLATIEGSVCFDVLEFHNRYTERRTREREETRRIVLTKRQEKVERIINKLLWKGEGCERIAIGRNLIFVVKHEGKPVLYVVDNPGVGAIFHYDDEASARELATGRVTRMEAIKRGARRIIHLGAWEDRASEVVQAAIDRAAGSAAAVPPRRIAA